MTPDLPAGSGRTSRIGTVAARVATVTARGLRAFGRFWWDFLVGDTPELFVAVLVIVGVALLLRHHRWAGVVTLPLLAVVALGASTYRGRKRPRPGTGARRSR